MPSTPATPRCISETPHFSIIHSCHHQLTGILLLLVRLTASNDPHRPPEMRSTLCHAAALRDKSSPATKVPVVVTTCAKQLFVMLFGDFLAPDGPAWFLCTSHALLWLPLLLSQQHILLRVNILAS